jgi:hypothetical protein
MPHPSPLQQELLSDAAFFAVFFIVSALVFWWLSWQRRNKSAKMIDYVPSYTRSGGERQGDDGGASASGGQPAAEECAVCLGALEDGDVCCVLPACRHEFHRECMRRWFMTDNKSTCPLCRTEVQPPSGAEIV